MRWLKRKVRLVRALPRFLYGWLAYVRSGQTPPSAYQALIQLFCTTGGRFNEYFSDLIAREPVPAIREPVHGVLGTLDASTINTRLAELRAKGYLTFPSALSGEQCDRLMQFAMTTRAHVRRMDGERDARVTEPVNYDPDHPLAVRYDYDTQDLLDCADVQALLADPTLLTFAQQYLQTTPKADILSMWWHTNFQLQPDSESAQLYHFDMDRIKWLKIFIYLTDVGPDDGPHAFISESHKPGGIPLHFLDRGYVRLSDEEVLDYYGEDREVTFAAPRGTIILEDTRGLHKGATVGPQGSARLLLQLQFSNSLFGAITPDAKINKIVDSSLQASIQSNPAIYQQYT